MSRKASSFTNAKPVPVVIHPCAFERKLTELGLPEDDLTLEAPERLARLTLWSESQQLKQWCLTKAKQFYVPEALLDRWDTKIIEREGLFQVETQASRFEPGRGYQRRHWEALVLVLRDGWNPREALRECGFNATYASEMRELGKILETRPFAKAIEDVIEALGLPHWTDERTQRWWYERSAEQLQFLFC